ncbi:tyrosine kinase receptor Cad96Ca-like [Ptychodera flava]|uniref:tyrosine kinase receptor Cad96Ca-like n=1 Tax=Ptychodera flava TaxID=63121 RepID=UPI00396AABE3
MRSGADLDLTNVTRDMAGYYTCLASNTFYDNTLGVGNSTTYLDVLYKPSIQRSKFSDKVEAEITANASLVCVVSANPAPTFKWHKDGKSVDGSSEETTVGTETTSTLTLTFVSNADYGEYVSTATNDLLEDQCKIKLVRIGLSSEDSTPWYWPAIIVTCSCLFIGGAVFLGCVLYKRRKNLLRQGNAQRTSLGSTLEDFGQNKHEDEDRYQDLCFTETEEPGTGTDDIYMKLCERFHEFPREHVRMSQIIGTGSFGKVNMATASEIAGKSGMTVVAVKTVKDSASDDDKGRLMAELKILQRVEPHRNILPLLGCCTEEEPIYVIMELMGQGNLLKYLRDYRRERTSDYANAALMKWVIKSKDLVSFGRQIAIGMQYLASQSFVHGELAAKTVLLTNDKRTCKLSNIGLRGDNDIKAIRVKERKTRLPIRWFAPETLFSGEYSTMSDVWSFGIVLWEITALGKTPYPTAKNVMKVNDFISKGYRMKRPVYCDSKLYSVMVRCWSENKTERPSFSELATELGSMAKSREDFIDVKKACADTPDYKKAANEKCYETN